MNGCVSDAAVVVAADVVVAVINLHPVEIICGRVLQSTITLFAVSDLFLQQACLSHAHTHATHMHRHTHTHAQTVNVTPTRKYTNLHLHAHD